MAIDFFDLRARQSHIQFEQYITALEIEKARKRCLEDQEYMNNYKEAVAKCLEFVSDDTQKAPLKLNLRYGVIYLLKDSFPRLIFVLTQCVTSNPTFGYGYDVYKRE